MQNGNMKSLLKSVYDLSFILIFWLVMEATSAAALPLLIKKALHLPLTLTPFQHSRHILLQLAKPPSSSCMLCPPSLPSLNCLPFLSLLCSWSSVEMFRLKHLGFFTSHPPFMNICNYDLTKQLIILQEPIKMVVVCFPTTHNYHHNWLPPAGMPP